MIIMRNLKRLFTPTHLATLCALAVASSTTVVAQEKEWWFEVELIVFKRDQDPASVSEQFSSQISDFRGRADFNLITPLLSPDLTMLIEALPSCEASVQADSNLWLEQDAINISSLINPQVSLDELWEDKNWQTNKQGMTDIDLYLLGLINQFPEQLAQSPKLNTSADDTMASLNRAFALDSAADSATNAAAMPFFAGFTPQPVIVPDTLYCRFDSDVMVMANPFTNNQSIAISIEEVPKVIGGVEYPYSDSPYLLSTESLELNKLARDIGRQRGLSLLLHMGWRQEILFGQTKAKSMRLFGGRNYAAEFGADGKRLPADDAMSEYDAASDTSATSERHTEFGDPSVQSEDLFTRIRDALEQESAVEIELSDTDTDTALIARTAELWQLDGLFKVFLRYIKGTPYLHIDSELEYRAPTFSEAMLESMQTMQSQATENEAVNGNPTQQSIAPDTLASYKFNQLRRVISTQYHYFDHPMFGLVVQIRRYQRPEPPEPKDESTLAD